MDPSKRNAAALHQRVDDICDNLTNHFASIFAAASRPTDKTLAEVAQNELRIREESAALVKDAEDLITLIRELKELWLFGSLNTLTDPGDRQAQEEKALKIAAQIEGLMKKATSSDSVADEAVKNEAKGDEMQS
ncbi:hypothetical protein M011DRAFT_473757 [Sporormia fimetaria CBS 119925]|uniref:Mediator of RNA polymerase II transcription subunit 22 n=1 Tax=Sporormia fimetaria CBS 119925 TaxID=1340428 RepID=A0A6A6VKV2_9PLEO|nr:hypothetical protein M011DRAFT_473757 [Sporormia fimetaria CBS 119925]